LCYSFGMKKWRWFIVTAAIVIAVAIVIYWKAKACEASANKCISSFVASSKSYQATPPNEAIQACRESQGYFCRILAPANIPNILLVLVGIGAILAALGTLSAIQRQADLMERQTVATETAANAATKSAETAERAVILTERAEVLIESVGFTGPHIPGVPDAKINGFSRVTIVFKNYGRTRAENVRFLVGLIIPGQPETAPLETPVTIGPGGTQRVTFQTFNEILGSGTYQQIVTGGLSLSFSGKVTYNDIFGGSHVLECDGFFEPHTGTFHVGRRASGKGKTDKQNPN
jgi:hypothetical protein